uniref:GAGA-binding transcriptional activator n=1 Tax=Macrostomum lignano TaxID=282301 RepID=A0A1I8FUR7_9PLAT
MKKKKTTTSPTCTTFTGGTALTSREDAPISIAGMEAYIMRMLGEEVMQMRDPIDTDMAPFYHDNWDSGKMKLATAMSGAFSGCGHFVLCLLYMDAKLHGGAGKAQPGPTQRFWPRMRENLLGTGLLDRKTTCHAAGVYRWMQGFLFKNIFKRIEDDDPYKEIVRIPLTKTPKLHEFLLLHLYVMDEMHIMESDSHRDQYLNLMRRRRRSKSKSGWTRPVYGQDVPREAASLRAAMSSRSARKMLVDEPRAETQQSPDSHQEQKQQPQKRKKAGVRNLHESKHESGVLAKQKFEAMTVQSTSPNRRLESKSCAAAWSRRY